MPMITMNTHVHGAEPSNFSFAGCDTIANFTNIAQRGKYFGTAVVWGIALPGWITAGHYNESALTAYLPVDL